MADYTETKDGWGRVYPDGQVDTAWQDCEPLITPEQVMALHLWGLPLISGVVNPWTGQPDQLKPEDLKALILEAVSLVELESSIRIFPKQIEERHPYDGPEMESFGYMRLRQAPATSVQELAVVSSDQVNVWNVPRAWIETGNLHQGQINLVPFAVAAQSGTTVPVAGPSGLGLLPGLFRFAWVPALWRVRYTVGFPKAELPRVMNQLVGVVAAMEFLSMLAATYAKTSSSSLGIDGLSQSQSTPGPELFVPRLKDLGEKRKWLIKKLKHSMGLGILMANV